MSMIEVSPDLQRPQLSIRNPMNTKPGLRRSNVVRLLFFCLSSKWSGLFLLALISIWSFRSRHDSNSDDQKLYSAAVTRANLPITVLARGELESSKSEDVHCEVEGSQIKIVKILPEGTAVTKETVVIEFDTKELENSIVDRKKSLNIAINTATTARKEIEVEKNRCESMNNRAKRDLQRAEMNRDKYLDPKGEYRVEVDDLKAGIAEIERDLVLANEKLELYNKSYKRGFSSADQVRAKEQDVERSERRLDRDRAKLHLLEKFTRKQQESELKAAASDAALELERTKHNCEIAIARSEANAKAAEDVVKMEGDAVERLERQRDLCTVRAPHDGILVYAKDSEFDSSSRIKQGAVVYNNQKLFSLPDLSEMQVNVKIHESKVRRIEVGQSAEVRIDGYPLLHGTVIQKASLPDSNGFLSASGVKEYVSVVRIDDLPPGVKLLPRMSAEVTILVGEVIDALIVPLQAVTETSGEYFSYVLGSAGTENRLVEVGENNEKFIEIINGLEEGEYVTLDARVRITAELKTNEGKAIGHPRPPIDTMEASLVAHPKSSEAIGEMNDGAPSIEDLIQGLPDISGDPVALEMEDNESQPVFDLGAKP